MGRAILRHNDMEPHSNSEPLKAPCLKTLDHRALSWNRFQRRQRGAKMI